MIRPPKVKRRLITFTQQAEADLKYIAERQKMSFSETVRLGLEILARLLREKEKKG